MRRSIDPWRGRWDIPGGFCDPEEHPIDTVVREVREEVGLDVHVTTALGIWIDAYVSEHTGPPPAATLNCYYHAVPVDPEAEPVVDPEEAWEAAWFAPGDLPGLIAFPNHATQVLAAWCEAASSGTLAGGSGSA